MEEDKDDLHALLERAAKLMVKARYSAYGPVKIKVAGREELRLHGVQRLHEGQTWNPADRAWAEGEMNDTDARLWHPWLASTGRSALDGGVEGGHVWMACSCGAVLVRVAVFS